MAERDHRTVFRYAELTTVAARLARHAEDITNAARRDIVEDLLLASRIAHRFAGLQFRVGETIRKIDEHPDLWHASLISRELRDALEAAQREEGDA